MSGLGTIERDRLAEDGKSRPSSLPEIAAEARHLLFHSKYPDVAAMAGKLYAAARDEMARRGIA